METMGQKIKFVRKAKGLSQKEFARKLRMDQASVSLWEKDKIKPSGVALIAISYVFGVDISWLEGSLNLD